MEKVSFIDYKEIVHNNPFIAFAYHKIITNNAGKPIDYEYIEANNRFELFTGLKAENIIGKKVTEIIPGIEKDSFNWIKFFGDVALTGKPNECEQFSEQLMKWYSVLAVCPVKGYFIALFYDITSIKRSEYNLKIANDEFSSLNEEYQSQNEELQSLLEELHEKKQILENSVIDLEQKKDELQISNIIKKSILNSASSGLLAVDNKGEIIFSNQKFYDIWQIPADLRSKRNEESLIEYIILQLIDPYEFTEKVKRLYKSDGISNDIINLKGNKFLERYSEPLIKNKEIIGRVWSFNDITDKENQHVRLEKINKILNGIRSLNKIQASAKDKKGLIESVCKNLVSNFGFKAVMISLFDNDKYIMSAQDGFGIGYLKIEDKLKKHIKPNCFQISSQQNDLLIVSNQVEVCANCDLYNKRSVNSNCIIPIKINKKLSGYINLNYSDEYSGDKDFQNLLREIADEVGVALLRIELESKQKEHLLELKLRENKLNSILQSSPVGIGYSKNRILWNVNDKFCEITGYSKIELSGEKIRRLYALESEYAEVGVATKKLEKKNNSITREVKWKKKDGKIIDVLLNISTVNPLDPNEGFSFTVEDITDRNKNKLIQRIIFNITNESIQVETIDLLVLYIRNELEKLFNTENFYLAIYNPEKKQYYFPFHKDKYESDYIDKDDLFDLPGSLTDYVRSNKKAMLIDLQAEKDLVLKGKLKSFGKESKVWMGAPLLDSKGDAFGVIAVQHYEDENAYSDEDLNVFEYIAKDLGRILEKKQFENALIDSEEKYRILIENIGEGVTKVDLKENIMFINPAGATIFGLSQKELIGKNLSEFLDKDQFEIVRRETFKRIEGKKSTYELIINNSNGYKKSILLTATPLLEKSRVIGNLGIFRDISDRKKVELMLKEKNEELQAAEEELRASNDELHNVNTELENRNDELVLAKEKAESADRLKSAFLANMSHEIRTPMNSILGFAGLLKKANLPVEKQVHFIDIININGSQLLRIIDDIIDFSKIEANQLELHKTQLNLISIIDEVFFTLKSRYQIEKKDVDFILHKPQVNEFLFITDETRLKQVIFNLVSNAFKFTEKGSIVLTCSLHGENELLFSVKDTGIGISPDKFEIIFDRFRQVDESTCRKYGGNGLGLAISKSIITMFGGKIWVESNVGGGAQFFFTIPVEKD